MDHLLIWIIEAIVKALKKPDDAAAAEAARRRWEEAQLLAARNATGPSQFASTGSVQSTIPLPAAPRLPAGGVGGVSGLSTGARRQTVITAPLPESAARVTTRDLATARSLPGSADTIARWARPGTLRSQFILTEILKPPLALREPRPQ